LIFSSSRRFARLNPEGPLKAALDRLMIPSEPPPHRKGVFLPEQSESDASQRHPRARLRLSAASSTSARVGRADAEELWHASRSLLGNWREL
jgi:hypothetical protein